MHKNDRGIQQKRKTKTMVLGLHPMLWGRLSFLSVRYQAATRPSHVRFVFRLTCISIMGLSHTSVLSRAVIRPSVRSRTLRFIWESIQTWNFIRVHKIVVRASGQRGTCWTTSVATLGISKCFQRTISIFLTTACINYLYCCNIGPLNATTAAPTTTAKMCSRLTGSSASSPQSSRWSISATRAKRNNFLSLRMTVKRLSLWNSKKNRRFRLHRRSKRARHKASCK